MHKIMKVTTNNTHPQVGHVSLQTDKQESTRQIKHWKQFSERSVLAKKKVTKRKGTMISGLVQADV